MNNDAMTTILNFMLAVFIVLSMAFAALFLWHNHEYRALQFRERNLQIVSIKAQALVRDVVNYNATAKSPELNQILQAALSGQAPAK
jgi:hypothetical protein